MNTTHIFAWGRPRDRGEPESPADERDPERCSPPTECDFETTPHWMWFWDHPPLNVILRSPPTECDFEITPHWMWFWDHPHWMWFWDHPHWMWFWVDTQQNQSKGTRIPRVSTESNHSFRPIHSLSPCISPRLPFTYCNPTEECFSSWRWKVFNRLLTNNHSSPGHRWCLRYPMSGLYLPYQKNCSWNPLSFMMWMRTCGQTHKTGLIQT